MSEAPTDQIVFRDIEISWYRCQTYERTERVYRCPYDPIITAARYGGCYEGGEWLAFAFLPDDNEAFSGDNPCMNWWEAREDMPIGRGDTPNDALADLKARVEKGPPQWLVDWWNRPVDPKAVEEATKALRALLPSSAIERSFYANMPLVGFKPKP